MCCWQTLCRLFLKLLLVICLFQYKDEDEVVLWMNTVGPYHNRQETYAYFSLPFCKGTKVINHYHETLSEALQGVELEFSGYDMQFKVDAPVSTICMAHLTTDDTLKAFIYATKNDYWYQVCAFGSFLERLNCNSCLSSPDVYR